MTPLWQSFARLPAPEKDGAYTVDGGKKAGVRVAKAFNGNAALLIAFQHRASSTPRRLLHLSYVPPTSVELTGSDGQTRLEEFAILECHSSDIALQKYFFHVAVAVLMDQRAAENEENFERTLDKLVTLFMALRRPASRSIQGVWAELAVMCWASEPATAISAWHSSPFALHDFANGDFKLEVKSTQSRLREHHFRLAQLAAIQTGHTVVASLLLSVSDPGDSVHDLVTILRAAPNVPVESVARVETIVAETLGADWFRAAEVRFDLSRARHSFQLYDARDIPAVPQPLPSGVKDVQFLADLSTSPAIPLQELRVRAPFYQALLPGE